MLRNTEDFIVDKLAEILNQFATARRALNRTLAKNGCPIPNIRFVETREGIEDSGIPDILGYTASANLVLILEAKLEAPLTSHQKETYWFALPDERDAALVFLAPEQRCQSIFKEVANHLESIGEEFTYTTTLTRTFGGSIHDKPMKCLTTVSWESLISDLSLATSSHNNDIYTSQVGHLEYLVFDA